MEAPRLRRLPPPAAPDLRLALAAADPPLAIHAMTIPAYGHYQTLKGILLALAARGHNVTLLGCAATGRDAAADGLLGRAPGAHGGVVHFHSLGACPSYEGREAALGALIAGAPGGIGAVLGGVRQLSQDMCAGAMAYYAGDPAGRLPQALVFDADTYCAMDVSVRWRVPRVARVGTGLRDCYTTPLAVPAFSSGQRLAMGLGGRLANAASLALSRALVAPLLVPWLYSGHRAAWLAAGGAAPGAALARHGALVHSEAAMAPHLLWDGVPTLYNSHWGLEHARPLAPYEHLIGHSNDFLGDAAKGLEAPLLAWLSASPTPVVYLGLGTLGVLPSAWVERLAAALTACPHARFVWSVPLPQQAQLPAALQRASARAHCMVGNGTACSQGGSGSSAAATAGPGSVLLVPWAPQLAILMHPAVAAFATHGGMNGIAEGLYARLPLLCIPLFADQPDNCAHAADKGYAAQVQLSGGLQPEVFSEALGGLLAAAAAPALRAALQDAWVRNVAAGGAARAVGIIEAAAALPYGAHLGEVPIQHFLPWYEQWGVDVGGVALLLLLGLLWACSRCCRAMARCCCCCSGGGGRCASCGAAAAKEKAV